MRISEKFRRHYRLDPVPREVPPRPFPLTWNLDLRIWGRQQIIVLATEEYTLFSLLLGLSRGRSVKIFQDAFRARLRELLDNIRWWQLPFLPMVTFSKRDNLSIVGCQTEFWRLAGGHLETAPKPVSEDELRSITESINSAPMSRINMDSPREALMKMITQSRQ